MKPETESRPLTDTDLERAAGGDMFINLGRSVGRLLDGAGIDVRGGMDRLGKLLGRKPPTEEHAAKVLDSLHLRK